MTGDSMERLIFHVDMDAFFAAVEELDNPDLRGLPVIVGGTSGRGVVSTASYKARKYGVHSAMPIFQARKRCPRGVFLPPRISRYREVSREVMTVLDGFSPLVEQVSIDEAYLDMTGCGRHFSSPEAAARELKKRVFERTSLTCSVGAAPNRFLAKIASDMHKPDGLTLIKQADVDPVIRTLPIGKVHGIGPRTASRLQAMGVVHLADIRRLPLRRLTQEVGAFGRRLMDLAIGVDEAPVEPLREPKSISSETTLPRDVSDLRELEDVLLAQAEVVGERLRRQGFKGSTITLKLKHSDHTQITRSTTLEEATSSTRKIFDQGRMLLSEASGGAKYRLIGIGVSHLAAAGEVFNQQSLFAGREEAMDVSWNKAEEAMDRIRSRFGKEAIVRARLFKPKNP